MRDVARRHVQSTNLGSQKCISSLPIPVPPETSTLTSIANSNYQGSCITNEFPWLRQQAGQQASQVIQISTKLGQGTHAHDLADHLRFSVLYISLPPHHRPRQMLFLGQNCGRPCERRHCSELGPLSLCLPFHLLPGFSDPLCATWDRNPFSTRLALGKQDTL